MNAVEVREEIHSWLKNVPEHPLGQGERGVLIGLINNALRLGKGVAEANARRHEVLAWLFRDLLGKPNATVVSTKELSDAMWWALYQYAQPYKDLNTGVWVGKGEFNDAMCACWQAIEAWMREIEGQLGIPDIL